MPIGFPSSPTNGQLWPTVSPRWQYVAAQDRWIAIAGASVVERVEDARDAAQAAQVAADAARALAQAARDSAAINAAVYADVAAAQADSGLANGSQYQVLVGDLIIRYRKDSAVASTPLLTSANGDFALSARRSLGLPSSTPYLAFAAGSITPSVSRAYTPAAATQYDIIAIVRGNECDYVHLLCQSGGSLNHDCLVRLSTQTIGRVNTAMAPPVQTPALRYLGGDRWEIKIRLLSTGTGAATLQLRPTLTGAFPFTGDTAKGVYVESWKICLAGSAVNLWSTDLVTDAAFTKTSLTASLAVTSEDAITAEVDQASDVAQAADVLLNGRMSGIRLTEATGASLNVRLYHAITLLAADVVMVQVRAKRDVRYRLNVFATVVNIDATFNLEAKTATGSGAVIEHLGNGWCQCTASATVATGGSTNIQVRVFPDAGGHPMAGTGVSSMYLEDVKVWVNGVLIIDSRSEDFARAIWVKESVTITQAAARYIGIAPALIANSQGPYNDGSAALVGLKVAAIGTSITSQAQYTGALVSETGVILTNLGVAGASLGANSSAGSLGIYNAISSIPADTELVLLEAGVNDHGVATPTPIGALGDTTTATFYGALYAARTAILTQAPNAVVAYLTPHSASTAYGTNSYKHAANSLGTTLVQFQQAVREVAALTASPLIDVGSEAGIGLFTASKFSDGFHPNATGGQGIGKYVGARLKRLVLDGLIV